MIISFHSEGEYKDLATTTNFDHANGSSSGVCIINKSDYQMKVYFIENE